MSPTPKSTAGSRRIHATSLNPDDFAPFGQVIQNPTTHNHRPDLKQTLANQGTATKWLDITHMTSHYDLGASKKPAKVAMNMFVCQPRTAQEQGGGHVFPVEILERHPFTPQTFIPLGLERHDRNTFYLVIVAPTLPSRSKDGKDELQPKPYPTDAPRPKRSLRQKLLGARPNPFTNDFTPSTTPLPASSIPLGSRPKGRGPPDLENVKAFIARGDQAVTYGPGTWHAPMVVLGERPIEFVVVQYANGVALEDCQEREVGGEGVVVKLDALDGENKMMKAKL